MNSEDFELLLAMMRLLKLSDSRGDTIETAIIKITRDFSRLLTDEQKLSVSREFSRYEALLSEKKKRREIEKEIEDESYRRAVSEFFLEEAF